MAKLKQRFNSLSNMFDTTYYYRKLGQYLYQGYVPASEVAKFGDAFLRYSTFHEYKGHNDNIARRKSANLPKIIGEYLVKNIFVENPEMNFGEAQNYMDDVFIDNNFCNNLRNLVESTIHLGGGYITTYIRDSKIKYSYIDGINGFILDYKDRKPNEAVFYSIKKRSEKTMLGTKKTYYYTLLMHHYEEDGKRIVDYEMYKDTIKGGFSIDVSDHITNIFGSWVSSEREEYNIDVPTFVYLKTPIKNNKDLNSYEGLGQLINGIDSLMVVDESFDAMSNEVVNGRLQLAIPEHATNLVQDGNGGFAKLYDPKNPHQFVYGTNDSSKFQPEAFAPIMRIDQQIMLFNTSIDMVCVSVGVKAGTFRFDGKSMQTATQVIVEQKDTAQTIMNYENEITRFINELTVLTMQLSQSEPALVSMPNIEVKDITINYFDGIGLDDETRKAEDKDLIDRQMMQDWKYLVKWEGLTEEEAKLQIEESRKPDEVDLDFNDEIPEDIDE